MKDLVRTAVVKYAERFDYDPVSVYSKNDRVSYLGKEYIELDISRAWRAVALPENGKLHLLMFGDHDLIARQRYTQSMLKDDLSASRVPVSTCFAHALGAPATPEGAPKVLVDALSSKWVYELK